jgi:hypothetical protein
MEGMFFEKVSKRGSGGMLIKYDMKVNFPKIHGLT